MSVRSKRVSLRPYSRLEVTNGANLYALHARSLLNLKGPGATVKEIHNKAGTVETPASSTGRNVSVSDKSIIAVMGGTGSGKSSFIKGVTGRSDIVVGHTLHSETCDIQTYDVKHGDTAFVLADTPGFDDTTRSDFDVLYQISDWLKSNFDAGKRLTGIIYLHPISSTRLQGSSLRTMSMFDKLCGEENRKNVLLVTTFWNAVPAATAESREIELGEIDSMWKTMKDRGTRIERMARDYERFNPILAAMSGQGDMKLRITEELKEGKSLEETMAGMALTDNAELDNLEETYKKIIAEKRAEAARRREETAAKLAAAHRAEEELNKQEDAKLAARLKEAEREHERRKQQREKEMEESKARAEKLAAAQRKWKAEQEEKALRTRQQDTAKTHLRASDILKSNVENSIDTIRAAYAAGITRISIGGVSSRGFGFSIVDANGNRGNGWSVDRSQINIWCDACSSPIGSAGVLRCNKCIPGRELTYCLTCHEKGFGCLDRTHKLLYDTRLCGNKCRRANGENGGLVCDRLDCRKSLEGLYLHCCECDGDDFDICLECVIIKGRGCRNASHNLKWGVVPISLPGQLVQELNRISGLEATPFQDYTNLQVGEAVMLCAQSKRQMDHLLKQMDNIEVGIRDGTVGVKVTEFTIPGWCDACMVMNGSHQTYTCDQTHSPFPEGMSFSLCAKCFNGGKDCPGAATHPPLKAEQAPASRCSRMLQPPNGSVTCDVPGCGKNVKGLFLHCCICSIDDFDVCADCVLNGWGCGNPAAHQLKFYFQPPFDSPT